MLESNISQCMVWSNDDDGEDGKNGRDMEGDSSDIENQHDRGRDEEHRFKDDRRAGSRNSMARDGSRSTNLHHHGGRSSTTGEESFEQEMASLMAMRERAARTHSKLAAFVCATICCWCIAAASIGAIGGYIFAG